MTNKEPVEQKPVEGKKLVVILVRGLVGIKKPVKDTLRMLRLTRKNQCVVIEGGALKLGMVKKVKDYVTWGEIDDALYLELVEKRGEGYKGAETCSKGKIKYDNKFFVHKGKKYKRYFRLNPPRKGFGRKGIKMPFKVGGGLGYRGEKINDLVRRML